MTVALPLTFAGAARVYTFDTLHVGSVWTQVARLTASDAGANDRFGNVRLGGRGRREQSRSG